MRKVELFTNAVSKTDPSPVKISISTSAYSDGSVHITAGGKDGISWAIGTLETNKDGKLQLKLNGNISRDDYDIETETGGYIKVVKS